LRSTTSTKTPSAAIISRYFKGEHEDACCYPALARFFVFFFISSFVAVGVKVVIVVIGVEIMFLAKISVLK